MSQPKTLHHILGTVSNALSDGLEFDATALTTWGHDLGVMVGALEAQQLEGVTKLRAENEQLRAQIESIRTQIARNDAQIAVCEGAKLACGEVYRFMRESLDATVFKVRTLRPAQQPATVIAPPPVPVHPGALRVLDIGATEDANGAASESPPEPEPAESTDSPRKRAKRPS